MIPIRFLMPIILFITVATFFAIDKYVGESYIFILFTITSNALLYMGFRKNALFFDTFIGLFLWLGFWLKTTIRVIFLDGKFAEYTGVFNGSPQLFDDALLVSSVAFIALIFASILREKFVFNYPEKVEENSSLFLFYTFHRKKILAVYILLFIFIAATNFYFSIYQRGMVTQTILPFGLNGIYKWLLLFGLSSFAAIILKYEFRLQDKTTFFVPILTLVEASITSASLLSRGMILNASALGLGLLKEINFKDKIKFWLVISIVFVVLFFASVVLVNQLRHGIDSKLSATESLSTVKDLNVENSVSRVKILLIDRWVGSEGVLAISSSSDKSWILFEEALKEKYDEHKTSFYDQLIHSGYTNSDTSNKHILSLPGFIAFFYYPGSIIFLFFTLMFFSFFGSFVEIVTHKMGKGNMLLSALMAQVVAYRFIHFGYVPAQSYLLFGTIFLNIFIIYGADKILSLWYKHKS